MILKDRNSCVSGEMPNLRYLNMYQSCTKSTVSWFSAPMFFKNLVKQVINKKYTVLICVWIENYISYLKASSEMILKDDWYTKELFIIAFHKIL